jgi:hypothetical protein
MFSQISYGQAVNAISHHFGKNKAARDMRRMDLSANASGLLVGSFIE